MGKIQNPKLKEGKVNARDTNIYSTRSNGSRIREIDKLQLNDSSKKRKPAASSDDDDERVQPSLDYVPHRYLLAEAGDTLFASFVGTKQYKDMMADANIFQEALFHEDEMENVEEAEVSDLDITNGRKGNVETRSKTPGIKAKQMKHKLKPAAHRGFMARAKGIPALELYKLAQMKKRKLVLCGHSLGGADKLR